MGQFEVQQRTSDCMFNATALLEQWNEKNTKKKIINFLGLKQTVEFVDVLKDRSQSQESDHAESVDNQVVIKGENGMIGSEAYVLIKGRMTKSGKTSDTYWMHPYLFIDFAMWLNPRFRYEVIKFVYDQLVQFRHDAGDNFKIIQAAITRWRPTPRHRAHLSKALNCIVFGKHGRGLRNNATEEQLQSLSFLERKYTDLVNEGYIRNYNQLIEKLRIEWNDRQKPF